jgi:RNA-directed DNA polymerase
MTASTECKVERLRTTLGLKAKQEPHFRFYSLHGHIYRLDMLRKAWHSVEKNGGSPGVDQATIQSYRESGIDKLLEEIHQELKSKTYRPSPVKRVYIPKANGKRRPLGIPTVKDRIVQTATLLVLEPIFEADFQNCSYGFRPGRSAHDALREVHTNLKEGYLEVYDADLAAYFDTIPHDKLLLCVEKRIADRNVIRLIQMWLQAPIQEDEDGKGPRITRPKQGTPQGGVISPLLANLYLHWFDKVFLREKHSSEGKLIRYADDFVIMTRRYKDEVGTYVKEKIETWLGLKINEEKTKVVDLKKGEELTFLGYTFVYHKDLKGRDKKYLNMKPSKKAIQQEKDRIKEITSTKQCYKPLTKVIEDLNRNLRGWNNYFKLGYPRKALREINYFVHERLKRHAKRRSQRRYTLREGSTYYEQFRKMGLKTL